MTPDAPHIALCMLAKAPIPGQVKTRLIPFVSATDASALHRAFILDLARRLVAVRLASALDLRLYLSFAGQGGHEAFAPLLSPAMGFIPIPQSPGDLGQKMTQLVHDLFGVHHASQVVLIGSDSPTMPARVLHHALGALGSADVVLGPSFDGGYYLVGMNAPEMSAIFEGIPWSTDQVLSATQRRCVALGLGTCELEFWYDVDLPEDLVRLRNHLIDSLARGQEHEYSETLQILRGLDIEDALS